MRARMPGRRRDQAIGANGEQRRGSHREPIRSRTCHRLGAAGRCWHAPSSPGESSRLHDLRPLGIRRCGRSSRIASAAHSRSGAGTDPMAEEVTMISRRPPLRFRDLIEHDITARGVAGSRSGARATTPVRPTRRAPSSSPLGDWRLCSSLGSTLNETITRRPWISAPGSCWPQ